MAKTLEEMRTDPAIQAVAKRFYEAARKEFPLYEELAERRSTLLSHLEELRGKDLACWCSITKGGCYNPCHADVLLALANDMSEEDVRNENLRRSEGEAV